MTDTLHGRAGDRQHASDGLRPFFREQGADSITHPAPQVPSEGLEGGAPFDLLGERLAEARARDLASAAEMADVPDWVLEARARARDARDQEAANEARARLEQAEKRTAEMRRLLEKMDRLRGEGADRSFAGFTAPDAASSEAEVRAREDAEWRAIAEHTLAAVRGTLGQWTSDSETRCEQTSPATIDEQRDAKRLGARGWALSRLGMCGSLRDLGYVVEQIRLDVGDAILGRWVCEAMGLRRDGRSAQRQLFTEKARRKLLRSYVLWRCGSYGPLKDFAGSPSSRRVRGVRRCPQKFLARVLAVGGVPWSRGTTTRDASEAHKAGLWRRIRLPQEIAPAEERAGHSGQVVSRYVFELPTLRLPRRRRDDGMVQLAGALSSTQSASSVEWVARHAVRLAMTSVDLGGGLSTARAAAPPCV